MESDGSSGLCMLIALSGESLVDVPSRSGWSVIFPSFVRALASGMVRVSVFLDSGRVVGAVLAGCNPVVRVKSGRRQFLNPLVLSQKDDDLFPQVWAVPLVTGSAAAMAAFHRSAPAAPSVFICCCFAPCGTFNTDLDKNC